MDGALAGHLHITVGKKGAHPLPWLAPPLPGKEKPVYLLQAHHAVKGVNGLQHLPVTLRSSAWAVAFRGRWWGFRRGMAHYNIGAICRF